MLKKHAKKPSKLIYDCSEWNKSFYFCFTKAYSVANPDVCQPQWVTARPELSNMPVLEQIWQW